MRGRHETRTGTETGRLALSEVSHGFERTDVLEDVSLGVNPGEALAIIGPSGTGKTTLLRLLSLFYRPDEGTVEFDGTDVWRLSERERLDVRRRIGMVFQEANLFDGTVHHNVRYPLTIRQGWTDRIQNWLSGLGRREANGAVTDQLELVGLEEDQLRYVSSLSGGEAQRVAFARALSYDPEVLLLDEPTSDLDPRNTAILEDAIDAARSRGLGVVMATHDMHQAERVADRTAVMLEGRIIECGPTGQVFTDPADPRARRFIDGELIY